MCEFMPLSKRINNLHLNSNSLSVKQKSSDRQVKFCWNQSTVIAYFQLNMKLIFTHNKLGIALNLRSLLKKECSQIAKESCLDSEKFSVFLQFQEQT